MTINWTNALVLEPCACNAIDCPECGAYSPRECHTPKCQLCGRFTKRLHLIWRGFPPEPEHAVGDCCLQPGDRTQP